MYRSRSMRADWKWNVKDTRPFHFGWDKSAFAVWFLPLRFHSKSDCINMAQWSIQSFFLAQRRPNYLYHHLFQMKKQLKRLRKPSAIKWQKIKEYNSGGRQIFRGTGMKMTLTLESLGSQCDLHFADCVVPGWRWEWWTEFFFLKEKWVISREMVGIPHVILNAFLGRKY